MMLLVATTWPFDCAADTEFTEEEELVVGKVAEPDSWLARGAFGTPILFILSRTSIVATGPVFMRRREAWAITISPSAHAQPEMHEAGGDDRAECYKRSWVGSQSRICLEGATTEGEKDSNESTREVDD
jgi:hypothetical protein